MVAPRPAARRRGSGSGSQQPETPLDREMQSTGKAGQEMVVRVSVADTEAAVGLMQRILREVDVHDVNFEHGELRVRIDVERNPDETLVEVLNLLESWLGAGGHSPTSVEIDEHRYVLGAA